MSTSNKKAVVVSLYGVPGSSKTFLLNQLKKELRQIHFAFYEGSKMITTIIPSGLDTFQNIGEQEKVHWRGRTINTIRKNCADSGQVTVIARHFIF